MGGREREREKEEVARGWGWGWGLGVGSVKKGKYDMFWDGYVTRFATVRKGKQGVVTDFLVGIWMKVGVGGSEEEQGVGGRVYMCVWVDVNSHQKGGVTNRPTLRFL